MHQTCMFVSKLDRKISPIGMQLQYVSHNMSRDTLSSVYIRLYVIMFYTSLIPQPAHPPSSLLTWLSDDEDLWTSHESELIFLYWYRLTWWAQFLSWPNKLIFKYRTVGNFRGSNFLWFGELRWFRGFIFLWCTYSNHSVIWLKFSNFLWIGTAYKIHKNLNPTEITNHTVSKNQALQMLYHV